MSWHKHKCFVKLTRGSRLLVDIGQDHGHAILDADLCTFGYCYRLRSLALEKACLELN